MTKRLQICEVGLRDGLQNEKTNISTAQKAQLLKGLVSAGLDYLELTSFVSPKAVPQMADAAEISAIAQQYSGLRFTHLIFNDKGYERAISAGSKAIAIVLVVSETLCQRNSRKSVAESLKIVKGLLKRAKADGIWTRLYLASAWICLFDGPTPPENVIRLADEVWPLGVDELCLTDPIGHAHPLEVGRLMEQVAHRFGNEKLAVHLHDTQALGLANATAAIQAGVRIVDSSIGGLGGCPFAPGSKGNLATEDLVFMAHKMGFETGVNFEKLWPVVYQAETMVGRPIGGRIRPWWEGECQKRAQ